METRISFEGRLATKSNGKGADFVGSISSPDNVMRKIRNLFDEDKTLGEIIDIFLTNDMRFELTLVMQPSEAIRQTCDEES